MNPEEIYSSTDMFFQKLGLNYHDLKVQQEAENIFRIALKSDDSHIMIGPHGKHLETLTHLLKILLTKKTGEHITIHLEVNDYLEQKEAKLLAYIASKVQLVEQSGKEFVLPFFTAYERKKVHSYVSAHGKNVYTQSIGEGRERRIHLCKKDEKMTIDLDGDDI